MKHILLSAVLVTMLFSCTKTLKQNHVTATATESPIDSTTVLKTEQNTAMWYDLVIAHYIKNSDIDLIKLAIKNNRQLEWYLDRIEDKDSTKYLIFNIGKDEFDEGNTNARFTSCGWVYIDSISKKLYEYDLPNDTIIEWKKRY